MKRVALIVVAVTIGVIVLGAGLFWCVTSQPLYRPGMVRAGKNLRASLTPPEQGIDDGTWAMENDVQLHHFAAGEGRNVLILHGGPGLPYLEPWPGLQSLTDEFTFHYYDQRGSGQSTRPVDRFSSPNSYENMQTLERALGLGAHVADIERIRQILGQDKLILIGHSFGGFVASLYAAEFPERVEAMVLIAPAGVLVMPPKEGGLFEDVRERLPEHMQEEYEAYIHEYLDFRDLFAKSESQLVALNGEFYKYYQAVADTPIPAQGAPGGWVVQAIYVSMGRRHDYRGALETVGAPVLVLHGRGDLQSEAVSRMYVDALPNARFETMDSAHFAFYEQSEAFAELVGGFLRDLR